jgi:hypothetical protein
MRQCSRSEPFVHSSCADRASAWGSKLHLECRFRGRSGETGSRRRPRLELECGRSGLLVVKDPRLFCRPQPLGARSSCELDNPQVHYN